MNAYRDFKCTVARSEAFKTMGDLCLKSGGLAKPDGKKHNTSWFVCHKITNVLGIQTAGEYIIRMSAKDFPGALKVETVWGQSCRSELGITCLKVRAFKFDEVVFTGVSAADALYTNATTVIKRLLGDRVIKDGDVIVGYLGIAPRKSSVKI